jgi:hypothetical protein
VQNHLQKEKLMKKPMNYSHVSISIGYWVGEEARWDNNIFA